MKFAFAILVLMLSNLVAAETTNAYGVGSVVLDNGAIAEVDVFRYKNPTTGVMETSLFYNTCPGPSLSDGCQQGWGFIPASVFKGFVYYPNITRPDVLTLVIDTDKVPGFRNYLCFSDEYSYCATQSPTNGGVIAMTWTRTNATALIDTYTEKLYALGSLTGTTNNVGVIFSARPTGTFFGSQVTEAITPTSVTIGGSTYSQVLIEKLAAIKMKFAEAKARQ